MRLATRHKRSEYMCTNPNSPIEGSEVAIEGHIAVQIERLQIT